MALLKKTASLILAAAMFLTAVVAAAAEVEQAAPSIDSGERQVTQSTGWQAPKLDLSVQADPETGLVTAAVTTAGCDDLGAFEFILNYPQGLIFDALPTEIENLPGAEVVDYAPGQIKVIWVSTDPAELAEQTLIEVCFTIPESVAGEHSFTLSGFAFSDINIGEEINENPGVNSCDVVLEGKKAEALKATYGDTLADVALPEGWAWQDAGLPVGSVGPHEFTAVSGEESKMFEIQVEPLPIAILGAEAALDDGFSEPESSDPEEPANVGPDDSGEQPEIAQPAREDDPANPEGPAGADSGNSWTLTEVLFDLPEGEQLTLGEDYEVRDLSIREKEGRLLIRGTVTLLETDNARNFVLIDDKLAYDMEPAPDGEEARDEKGPAEEPEQEPGKELGKDPETAEEHPEKPVEDETGSSAPAEGPDKLPAEPYEPKDPEPQKQPGDESEDASDSESTSPPEPEAEAEEVSEQ